ncbi:MAG: hypothetical protein GY801_18000 [bacterium]|nr:hypothetical protein [bacterium]
MRTFSSYGQVNTEQHYYAPRTALIERAYTQLVGDNPEKDGHYITVWAPRQTGKSSVMLEATKRLRRQEGYKVVLMTIESAKYERDPDAVLRIFLRELELKLDRKFSDIASWEQFPRLFTREFLNKPLILIIDEFDAIDEACLNKFASEFRKIYLDRASETDKTSAEKNYLLHSLALIGVRSVLGIENVSGSPFNIQRSLHIPNLTFEEVDEMFKWYARESGQPVEQAAIDRLYEETQGQPGLICWFGELLTEGFEEYRPQKDRSIGVHDFEEVYAAALYLLPNNTILNLLSKARQEPYTGFVLELFKTDKKIPFAYDHPAINYLYMNGVITQESITPFERYAKFACPFVQKRLFNYFSNTLFHYMGKLFQPFENLDDTINDERLNIRNLMKRYEGHLRTNREWLLKEAPRRVDLRIYEAVYHFNLYMYLSLFLGSYGGKVYPEFPTGNGKIDLLIVYGGKSYGIEVKSYTTHKGFQEALIQAARYGKQLGLAEISLLVFVEYIDEANRSRYEVNYEDRETGTTVAPVFVETGSDP